MKAERLFQTLAIATVAMAVVIGGQILKAGELSSDSFDAYAPGGGNSLVGQGGGVGWAGPWAAGVGNTADVVDTTANPLAFTPAGGATIDGGARAVELTQTTGNQIVATRQFAWPLPDTFYVAYLVRVTGGSWTDTDTCALHVSADTTSTTTPNFGLRGPNLFMVRTGTGTPVAGASNYVANATVIGTSSYVVARFSKLDASGNPTTTYDRVEIWVNPAADDNIGNPTGHARLQLAANSGLATAQYLLVRIAGLETADRAQIDQIVVGTEWTDIMGSPSAPKIADIVPANGTTLWPAANGFSFTASSPQDIEHSGISLLLNGVDVSGALSIGGTPTNRTVAYTNLADNVQYTAEITVSNAAGVSQATVQFDTYSPTAGLIIEVEDYNYDVLGECDREFGGFNVFPAGAFQDNPPVSGYDLTSGLRVGGVQPDLTRLGYVDALGVPGVDYFDTGTGPGDPVTNAYRFCDTASTRVSGDYRRPASVTANVPEYDVFRFAEGDWMNYTRTFSPAHYKVYLRVSSLADQQVQLDKVGGDTTSVNQTPVFHGVFRVPNTGGTNNYVYVPLTDSSGLIEVTVTLGGVSTVRLTALQISADMSLNYLVFVPFGQSLVPPSASLLAPAPDAVYPANADVPISVEAADADGSVTNVTVIAVSFDRTNMVASFDLPPYDATWSGVPDGRYTLTARSTDDNGLTTVSAPVEITVGTPPVPALFVVGKIPLDPGDAAVRNRLISLGLPVVAVLSTASTAADADGKSLVLVSSTVTSSDVGTKFTMVTVPVIQWEAALADEFRFSAGGPNVADQSEVLLTDAGAAHPLGAGLTAGIMAVRDTATTFHGASANTLAAGAVVVATVTTNNTPLILGIEVGALLNDNSPAPARRVHLFLGDQGVLGLNNAGLALFDAAVAWARGSVTEPERPAMGVSLTGSTVTISWPKPAMPFVLEENTDLANPAGWVGSALDADEVDGNVVVNIVAPTGNRFLRLRSNP